MSLFNLGPFTLASGASSPFKIDCDALTGDDWQALAAIAAELLPPFSGALGVPRGGLLFASALARHTSRGADVLLVVDDVLTTGGSITALARQLAPTHQTLLGVVAFARGPCPDWITPLFRLTLPGELS